MSETTTALPDSSDSDFNIWRLLQLVRRRLPLIMLVAALVTGGVVLWTMGLTKVYRATCAIEYDPSPPRPLGSEIEDVAAPVVNLWMSREWYQTQNRIIASRTIAERVVRELGLATDPNFFGVPDEEIEQWEGGSIEEAAMTLQTRLTVEQIPDTRIVNISVEDTDPERAALIVNTLADAYITRTTEERLGSTVRALEDLSEQLDSLRGELDRSELALHEFKRDNNVLSVSLEDQQNNVAADLRRYSEALTSARQERIAVGAQLNALRRAVQTDPSGGSARLLMENTSIQGLRRRAQETAEEVEELRARYGSNWPAVREAEARHHEIQRHLNREVQGLVASVEGQVRQLQQQEGALQTELTRVRDLGHTLNAHEIQFGQLTRERENHAKLYGILLERTAETNMTRMLRVASVRLVDRALTPVLPISPRMKVHVALGLIGGLGFGIALAFFFGRLDRSIRSVEQLESMGVTVIGALPTISSPNGSPNNGRYYGKAKPGSGPIRATERDLVVHTHPMSAIAESTRTLRTNLTFMAADNPLQVIAVTSALPLEGKTTVAISLAIAMAQSGKRTLLIDTDLRRPRIHRAFGISGRVGTTSVLVNDESVKDAAQPTDVPGLWILPSGPVPPNPSELLHSKRFSQLIESVRDQFDRIIFDSPPLAAVTDAAVVAPQIDGILLVIKANSTSRDAVRSSLRQIVSVRANFLGCVLNNLDFSTRGGYGGGRYYYSRGYYFRDGEDELMEETLVETPDEQRPSA